MAAAAVCTLTLIPRRQLPGRSIRSEALAAGAPQQLLADHARDAITLSYAAFALAVGISNISLGTTWSARSAKSESPP